MPLRDRPSLTVLRPQAITGSVLAAALAVALGCSAPSTAHAADSNAQAADALGAVTFFSGSAPTAAAGTSGTIAFVKGSNIWIARGDGSGARQVTRDGTAQVPYSSPSQSNTGVITAAYGTQIVRVTPDGRILTYIDPPLLRNSAGEAMDGPVNDVALSPDGTTIAWSYVRYSCPVGTDCQVRYATGYTAADGYRKAGNTTYYRAPSWVTNTRTLQTGGFGSQVMLHDKNAAPKHWFDDSDIYFPDTDLSDGEVSPNGQWLAEIRGYNTTAAIIWYRVTGNVKTGPPPGLPTPACQTGGDASHASPTWSPDSTALAWANADGIVIKRGAANCSTPQPTLAIPGGSQPDWSPAAFPTSR